MATPRHITFFGATGGCALAALVRTLGAGISCSALVRTPDKLTQALSAQGVPADTVAKHLTIVQGNVKDAAAVRKVLTTRLDSLPDLIVSGIGSLPRLQASIIRPVGLVDPTVTFDALSTIFTTLRALQKETGPGARKPLLCVISTTGVSAKARDVPLAFVPLYHWFLAVPHEDKRAMEHAVLQECALSDSTIGGAVLVRPSLLMDGPAKGLDKIRVGWEAADAAAPGDAAGSAPGPAVGYTISRNDVGNWIFEELVKSASPEQWSGRAVTLTD